MTPANIDRCICAEIPYDPRQDPSVRLPLTPEQGAQADFYDLVPLKVPDRKLTRQRVFCACWRAQAYPLTGDNCRNGFSAVSRRVLAQVGMRQNPPNIQEIANSTRYQRLVYTLPKKIIPVVEQMAVGIDLPMA